MNGRPYTESERQVIRDMHADHGAAEIAAVLGRSTRSVYRVFGVLGLRKFPWWPKETLAAVARLFRRGLPDRLIAAKLGLTHDQAKHLRSRISRECNFDIEAHRKAVKTQQATLGIKSGGELRQLAYRRFAIANGWPEDCRPREVQILNVLSAHGVPMTRQELATAIGMRTDREDRPGHVALLMGNGPGGTYSASLMRRGLLAVMKRASQVLGHGKGRSRDLYYLGPVALQILEAKAKCEKTTETTTAEGR